MNQGKGLVLFLPVLMFRPLCPYFANRTTLLKIVIYLDGSHTKSALHFYLQIDSALGVRRKSMMQGFALKEKSAKFETALVSIPQFFIHLMFVRSPQSMWVLEPGTAQILESKMPWPTPDSVLAALILGQRVLGQQLPLFL